MLDEGRPSGNADSNAHSSSSAAAGGGGACDCAAGCGVKLLKSKIDFCCGDDCRAGDVKAANGSAGGAEGFD